MPRGGARPNSGPAPAAQSQKKDREARRAAQSMPTKSVQVIDDGDWLTLPREGRTGNPPAWPLSKPSRPDATSRRELELWRRLWKMPQALGWERIGVELSVAMHVRTLVRAEQPDSKIGLTNTLRLQQDGLGLSPIGLRALKWRIGQAAKNHAEPLPAPTNAIRPSTGLSPKERLKLVSNGR